MLRFLGEEEEKTKAEEGEEGNQKLHWDVWEGGEKGWKSLLLSSTVYRCTEKKKAKNQAGCVASLGTPQSSEGSNIYRKWKKVRKSGNLVRHDLNRVIWKGPISMSMALRICSYMSYSMKWTVIRLLYTSSTVFLCQSCSAQIQNHNYKTKPSVPFLANRFDFLCHCSSDQLFKDCLMQTLIFSAGSWGFPYVLRESRGYSIETLVIQGGSFEVNWKWVRNPTLHTVSSNFSTGAKVLYITSEGLSITQSQIRRPGLR